MCVWRKAVSVYKQIGHQITRLIVLSIFGCFSLHSIVNAQNFTFNGVTKLMGNVIATPCSIVMQDRYQTINFSPLTLTMLATPSERERYNQPFIIELRDCGSVYSSVDSKTWLIRFDGQSAQHVNAFVLQGPSRGLGISVLDDKQQILIPNQNYLLSNSVLRQGKSGQTLFLRYFLQLELTGQPIHAGSYQGLIRFFIDYQ